MNNPNLSGAAINAEAVVHNTAARGRSREKPRAWWVMALLSAFIVLHGLSYIVLGERMFPPGELGESFRARPWGIYPHAFLATIALLLGPLQFHRGLLSARRRPWHRNLGKVYIVAALVGGGVCGLYMSAYSYGGWVTHTGFGLLAALTATTTVVAYLKIRAREVNAHREWMIRSFALIFAAVTLRLWLPLLVIAYKGQFTPAYLLVAWLSWVPNLAFAEWYISRSRLVQTRAVENLVTA